VIIRTRLRAHSIAEFIEQPRIAFVLSCRRGFSKEVKKRKAKLVSQESGGVIINMICVG
jgi:hypothetical protein